MTVGRPSTYSQELADRICEKLAEGLSLRTVCKEDWAPALSSVFKWLREKPEFSEQYAKAKEQGALAMFEEILDIADDGTNDWMEIHSADGEAIGWKQNGEAIQRSRLRVDTRKWALSKILPKKYGDRQQLEHTGPEGGPVQMQVSQMTREELMKELEARGLPTNLLDN